MLVLDGLGSALLFDERKRYVNGQISLGAAVVAHHQHRGRGVRIVTDSLGCIQRSAAYPIPRCGKCNCRVYESIHVFSHNEDVR